MYMHATKLRWSVEDLWALPDEPGKRYETVDGEVKTRRGGAVFSCVAAKYDVLTDAMSGGMHGLW